MKIEKLILKILNNQKNVKFDDFIQILNYFGFECDRISGSHHIFKNDEINELINIQNVKGEVKPYQIKQFISIIEKNGLNKRSK